MGSVRSRPDTGALFIDFRWKGKRIREYTSLTNTPSNHAKLSKRLKRIEAEIAVGTYVPSGPTHQQLEAATASLPNPATSTRVPTFKEFAETWLAENEVTWRRSYRITQRGALDKHLVPTFGRHALNEVTKAEVLAFRTELSKAPGRQGPTLSARRINAIMKPLRQILNEAADRYSFTTPFRNVKPLKMKRSDVMPFSLEEVQRILSSVRSDYRPYLTVRFFTGLRSGEAHGLKWKNVDIERKLIFVRESLVFGEDDELKTDGSQRDIQASQVVLDALRQQFKVTSQCPYVFTNTVGGPVDNKNFVNRIWNPLLDKLGLARRRPYQMRHTAATLWLAAGEAPEWIARQLGHTTTEMLFRVYSRYVPNLTRQDGSAMDRLLARVFEEPCVEGATTRGA